MAKLNEFSKLKASTAISATMLERRFNEPFISNRNRLEGLPREAEFDKSLKAEIADPLWMLTRQWQLGEFQGEDAGTACQTKILAEQQQPEILTFHNTISKKYDPFNSPLEPVVESERLIPNLFLRLQMGRQLIRILKENGMDPYLSLFVEKFPIVEKVHEQDREGMMLALATAGKYPDGYAVRNDINNGNYQSWVTGDPGVDTSDHLTLLSMIPDQFNNWFKNLYQEPDEGQNAWVPERLEYNFSLELPHAENNKQALLQADQYTNGRLDWDSFDENLVPIPSGDRQIDNFKEVIQTYLPTPLQYAGMPHPRFWQMEDSRIDFGKIQSGTTGLLSMLMMEYGITYSNDWFILPYLMKINTYCEVKTLLVTDVFGQHIVIEPTFKDPELNWHEFAVFRQTELHNLKSPRNRFYLSPSLLKIQQSDPLEKVNFIRDEMTNMVWAIESTVHSSAGGGREVKLNRPRFDPLTEPDDPESKIRYLAGTTVPENWIPFIPVHKLESEQEIRLQRARIPNAPPPTSLILLEQHPVHFIEEEEIPRSGIIVKRSFKRTRWLGGKTILWVGRSKTTGRGEGWSGLMFDRLLPIEKEKTL